MMDDKVRCSWVPVSDTLYTLYHDNEWGIPAWDNHRLFEMLILEGAQAGLSWSTILRKRENYRAAFDQFNPEKIASYDEKRILELLSNPGIVRNRRKIEAAITNAQAYIKLTENQGSFSDIIWSFVDGRAVQNAWEKIEDIPSRTDASDKLSKFLIQQGFKFVGTTITYAFMQAVGLVNDHTTNCYRYNECKTLGAREC